MEFRLTLHLYFSQDFFGQLVSSRSIFSCSATLFTFGHSKIFPLFDPRSHDVGTTDNSLKPRASVVSTRANGIFCCNLVAIRTELIISNAVLTIPLEILQKTITLLLPSCCLLSRLEQLLRNQNKGEMSKRRKFSTASHEL